MICPPFYNIFLTILNNLMIDGSMSGKKRNICNEFYTLCHIRFQALAIIGDKSILMIVEITMRLNTNDTIQVVESELSKVQITKIGMLEGICLATAIGVVAFIGLAIRGLFIFYIKYRAPKQRPINKLMLDDQVGLSVICYINDMCHLQRT